MMLGSVCGRESTLARVSTNASVCSAVGEPFRGTEGIVSAGRPRSGEVRGRKSRSNTPSLVKPEEVGFVGLEIGFSAASIAVFLMKQKSKFMDSYHRSSRYY